MASSFFDPTDQSKVSLTDKVNFDFNNISIKSISSSSSSGDSNSILSAVIQTVTTGINPPSDFFFVKGTKVFNYHITELYFYPVLHTNISGVSDSETSSTIVGELVIKLTKEGDTPNNGYVCFFLQYENLAIYSDIDKFKTMQGKSLSGGETVNLNDDIGQQKFCVNYSANPQSADETVDTGTVLDIFIFSKPITINADTQNMITTYSGKTVSPFTTNAPTNYEIILKNIATINDEQIYIDCNLTGESEEQITTYNIPINSAMAGEDAEMNYMKMTVNFFIFIIGLLFCYTVIPFVYKLSVIDRINKSRTEDKGNLVQAVEILTTIVSIFIILWLFFIGRAKANYSIQTASIALAVLYVLSFCIISIKKTDTSFLTTKITEGNKKIELKEFNISNLWNTFGLMKEWLKEVTNKFYVILVGIIVYAVTIVLFLALGMFSRPEAVAFFSVESIFFLIFIVMIGIALVPSEKSNPIADVVNTAIQSAPNASMFSKIPNPLSLLKRNKTQPSP